MNKKLAKQLKDMDFWSKHYSTIEEYPDKDGFVPPILSELIEACGEKFRALVLHHNCVEDPKNIKKRGEGMKWQAKPNQHYSKVKSQWARTQEEAVALLWLELNKK